MTICPVTFVSKESRPPTSSWTTSDGKLSRQNRATPSLYGEFYGARGYQSPNVIIDTTRATKLSDSAILRELKRLLPMTKSVRRLIAVTKSGDVIDIGKC